MDINCDKTAERKNDQRCDKAVKKSIKDIHVPIEEIYMMERYNKTVKRPM